LKEGVQGLPGRGLNGVSMLLRWFLIPALVVAAGVALVGGISILTTKSMSPAELLYQLRPGNSEARRWQAAYGLSAVVTAKKDELPPGFSRQLIRYFGDCVDGKDRGDPRFMQYLALALLNLRDRDAIPVFRRALRLEDDSSTRIYALMALSEMRSPADSLGGAVAALMDDPDPAIRTMAAYAAGKIGGAAAVGPLRSHLEDTDLDVRWNAALGLARMGDDSGLDLLMRMTDRTYLREVSGLDREGESEVVRNAVIGLGQLNAPIEHLLSRIAREDQDPEVRRAASESLRLIHLRSGPGDRGNPEE